MIRGDTPFGGVGTGHLLTREHAGGGPVILHPHADGDVVVCVGQAAHAWMSGEMARAWGGAEVDAPAPFGEVCLGVEQHDVGMAAWDRRPTLNPETGRPTTFLELPVQTHLELWRAAPGRVLTQSPYAALLVSLHGSALQRRREPTPAVRAFLTEQEDLQARLLAALGEDPERAERNRRLLWALDFLSLALLLEDWAPGAVPAPTRPGRRDTRLEVARDGTRGLAVAPWPFAVERLDLTCAGRVLEGRFGDERALHAALDAAPWVSLACTLRPG